MGEVKSVVGVKVLASGRNVDEVVVGVVGGGDSNIGTVCGWFELKVRSNRGCRRFALKKSFIA